METQQLLKNKKVEIIDRDKQVKCIIKNFQNNNIYYKDMVSCGKNLCYKNGVISVIDMDIPNPKYKATNEEWDKLEKDINFILDENE